jgi:uncharacterized protein (TIGR01777 family)
MNIVLAGGSGLIGKRLVQRLHERGDSVVLLIRKQQSVFQPSIPFIKFVLWDAATVSTWSAELETADAVINLSGEPIAAKRWTTEQKHRIFASRIISTRAITEAIHHTAHKPKVLLNASAVGFYGNVSDGEVTEKYPRGNGFLANVCEQWEREAVNVQRDGVRVALLRTGIVLDANGGALQKLLLPFQIFLGGYFGNGKQWFPWIHIDDEIEAIIFALENSKIEGAVNLAVPETVRMKEFCSVLGMVLHRPSWLPVPAFALKLLLGEMAQSLLLDGQKVIPQKLTENGYEFRYPKLKEALENLFKQNC